MKLRRLVLIIGGLVLLAVVLCVGGNALSQVASGRFATPTPEVEGTPVEIAVRARGEVVPAVWADLHFDTSGPVAEWFVAEGDTVEVGTPLGRLDTLNGADLERAVAQAELRVRQAQVGLAQAELELDQLQEPPDEADVRQAEHAVAQAAAAIEAARLSLTEVLNSTLLNETLDDAQEVFADKQRRYQYRLEQYEEERIDYWYVEDAKEQLDDARLTLDRIRQQGDAQSQEARNALAQAEQSYQEAQDALARLQNEADPLDVEAARKDIDAARLDVQEAELSLEQAISDLDAVTLVAPFDATVVTLHLQPYDWAQVGAVAVTLADLSTLRIETTDLDEWGAAQVHVGSEATIIFNAFDDKTLTGRVTEIDLRGEKLPAGDVVYRTVIELDEPDPDLRWGMTVRITVPIEP
jgi:HlyD family secretion protein